MDRKQSGAKGLIATMLADPSSPASHAAAQDHSGSSALHVLPEDPEESVAQSDHNHQHGTVDSGFTSFTTDVDLKSLAKESAFRSRSGISLSFSNTSGHVSGLSSGIHHVGPRCKIPSGEPLMATLDKIHEPTAGSRSRNVEDSMSASQQLRVDSVWEAESRGSGMNFTGDVPIDHLVRPTTTRQKDR